jgi:hypothetical protein
VTDMVYWFTSDRARIDAMPGEESSVASQRRGSRVKCKLVNDEAWFYDRCAPVEPYRITASQLARISIVKRGDTYHVEGMP